MKLFSGLACFSPSVPVEVKDAWIAHGGAIAVVLKERQLTQWLFCNGIGDPWLTRYSVRTVIVFHANWILASAASGFPLPLAKYVLDGRHEELNGQNIPFQRNLGSCHAGMSREPSEINPEIDVPAYDYSQCTRLATSVEGNYLRKRPHEFSSPEHRASARPVKKINKRKSRSSEVFQDMGPGLGTSTSEETSQTRATGRLAILPTSGQISAVVSNVLRPSTTSISFSSPGNTRALPTEQSDFQENSENQSEFSPMNRTDHDLPQPCEKLCNKGQVRNDMGNFAESSRSVVGSPSQLSLKNPIGAEGTPDGSCAGHTDLLQNCSTSNIWDSLIQQYDSDSTALDSRGNTIPVIRVSDALVALRRLNPEPSSDGNEVATLFVRGRTHYGRKFDVDKGDRRKTL